MKYIMKALFKTLLIAGLLVSASINVASAQTTAGFSGKVIQLTSSAYNYGGCMAQVSFDIQSQLPTCQPNYVSMGCDGQMPNIDKSAALANWSAVQLAYVTEVDAGFYITSDRRYNQDPSTGIAFCTAYRVDNKPIP